MISRALLIVVGAALLFPVSALAQDNNFFAGFDLSAGWASGSSSTTNGGAAFAGGGVVNNVHFDKTIGLGGHVGYKLDSALSAFISYQHVRGGVSWDANFPIIGAVSDFRGHAISNAIMGNLGYDWVLSDLTSIEASIGLGLSINSLSNIVETDGPTGLFLSDVADHSRISPAAQIGIGLQHKITAHLALGLNAAIGYTGGFETGDTRSGNLGITSITPYGIDHVWRASIGASVKLEL